MIKVAFPGATGILSLPCDWLVPSWGRKRAPPACTQKHTPEDTEAGPALNGRRAGHIPRKHIMNGVDIKELLDAGVHFGHRTQRWNPKMKPFIFEARNGIYVINLEHSVKQLEAAQDFLAGIAASGKKALFA